MLVVGMASAKDRFRRIVEMLLPWYDPEAEKARNAKTEAIRLRSIAARVESERVIEAYRKAPWPRR